MKDIIRANFAIKSFIKFIDKIKKSICKGIRSAYGIDRVMFMTVNELMKIPRMDLLSANEIEEKCRQFLEEKQEDILASLIRKPEIEEKGNGISLKDMLHDDTYRDIIQQYLEENNNKIESLGLSKRACNSLKRQKVFMLSDLIFLSDIDLDLYDMTLKPKQIILHLK